MKNIECFSISINNVVWFSGTKFPCVWCRSKYKIENHLYGWEKAGGALERVGCATFNSIYIFHCARAFCPLAFNFLSLVLGARPEIQHLLFSSAHQITFALFFAVIALLKTALYLSHHAYKRRLATIDGLVGRRKKYDLFIRFLLIYYIFVEATFKLVNGE